MKQYLSIPFDANAMLEKKKHPVCDIKESIQMNINLILKTHFTEYRYNPKYGCYIWDQDYSTISNISNWLDELQNSILSSIELNERRISKTEIKIDLEESEFFERFKGHPLRLKHKLSIKIKGVITHLNEPFEHYEFLFFSPLSIA